VVGFRLRGCWFGGHGQRFLTRWADEFSVPNVPAGGRNGYVA
jgi:hypothetical protein